MAAPLPLRPLLERAMSSDPAVRNQAIADWTENLDPNSDHLLAMLRFALDTDPSDALYGIAWLFCKKYVSSIAPVACANRVVCVAGRNARISWRRPD